MNGLHARRAAVGRGYQGVPFAASQHDAVGHGLPPEAFEITPQLRMPGQPIRTQDDLVSRMITFLLEDLSYAPFELNDFDCKIDQPRDFAVPDNVIVMKFLNGKTYRVTVEEVNPESIRNPDAAIAVL